MSDATSLLTSGRTHRPLLGFWAVGSGEDYEQVFWVRHHQENLERDCERSIRSQRQHALSIWATCIRSFVPLDKRKSIAVKDDWAPSFGACFPSILRVESTLYIPGALVAWKKPGWWKVTSTTECTTNYCRQYLLKEISRSWNESETMLDEIEGKDIKAAVYLL
jgi:hypothetical protein